MSELSPKAASLVRAARFAPRPMPADRQRVTALLRARLGSAVLPLEIAVASSLFARISWAKLAALAMALGVIGGAGYFAARPAAPAPSHGPLHQLDLREAALSNEPTLAPTVRPRPSSAPLERQLESSPRRPTDRLAQEVAILSRATSELHGGRAASALDALDEHRQRFPAGLLTLERRAARAQALCSLGRRRDADAELERLAKMAPHAPLTANAKRACDSSPR